MEFQQKYEKKCLAFVFLMCTLLIFSFFIVSMTITIPNCEPYLCALEPSSNNTCQLSLITLNENGILIKSNRENTNILCDTNRIEIKKCFIYKERKKGITVEKISDFCPIHMFIILLLYCIIVMPVFIAITFILIRHACKKEKIENPTLESIYTF